MSLIICPVLTYFRVAIIKIQVGDREGYQQPPMAPSVPHAPFIFTTFTWVKRVNKAFF